MASMESPTARAVSRHADKLLGLPYTHRGRGPSYDCFGLFLELVRRCGLDLEDPFTEASFDRGRFRRFYRRFRRVDPAGSLRPLDVLLQRHERQHVSVVVEPGWVLDTSRGTGSHRLPLRDALQRATIGVYRLRCL